MITVQNIEKQQLSLCSFMFAIKVFLFNIEKFLQSLKGAKNHFRGPKSKS